MSGPEQRIIVAGVVALALAMLLLEVLAFRLCAAVLGPSAAMLAGFCLPGAAALGAAAFGERPAPRPATLGARAAHLAALSGALLLAGTVAFSWASQAVAAEEGDALHVAVAVGAWLVPALFGGGSLALAWRLAAPLAGRVGWAEAAGGALGCLLVPLLLAVEAPRAALATALPLSAASLAFAYAGRRAEPRWALCATLPLAAVVLLAGDVGSPWLRVRTDIGRRSAVGHARWTTEGLIAVDAVANGRSMLALDKAPKVPFVEGHWSKRKPRFEAQDLVYSSNAEEAGPALVVGSFGGRDAAAALAYDHAPVDAIESHPALVNAILADRYARQSGYLLSDERLNVQIGGSRAAERLPVRSYGSIVVMGEPRALHTAPRLLPRHDRLLTRAALSSYLERLAPDGALALRVRREALPGLLATVQAALGGQGDGRIVACSDRQGAAVVVVHASPLTPRSQLDLERRCRRNRLKLEHPDPDQDGSLWTGRPATAARPFLEVPPPLSELLREAWRGLVALESHLPSDATPSRPTGPPEQRPAARQASIALGAGLVLLVLLAVLLAAPLPRGEQPRRIALSLAPFGAALGLSTFAIVDRMLAAGGPAALAWTLWIPLGLAGAACGRLWVDTVSVEWLRRRALLALAIAGGWLVLVLLAAMPLADALAAKTTALVALAAPLLLFSGAALGAPLAAAVRLAGEYRRVGRAIALHHAGWALGGALAVLLAELAGTGAILPVGIGAYLLGGALLGSALGPRRTARLSA